MAEYASGLFNKPAPKQVHGPFLPWEKNPADPPEAPTENTPYDPSNPLHVDIVDKRNVALKANGSPTFIHPETGEIQQPQAPVPANTNALQPPAPANNNAGLGGGGGFGFSYSGDKANFGKTPHQIADEKLTAEHLARMGGLDKEGAAAAALGEEQKAEAFAAHYQALQEMEAKRIATEKERQLWVTSALEKHAQEAEALAKSSISADHWWNSKSTEQKITAGIGMALIAFGAGLSAAGGGDASMGMRSIEAAIDRDIAAQKANLDNRWAGFKAKQGLYAARLQAFQDERVAEASAKASAWELVGMKIRGIEGRTSSDLAKTQAKKLGEQADYMVGHYKNEVAMLGEKAWEAYRARLAAAGAAADKDLKEQNKKLFEAKLKYVYEKRGLGDNEQLVQGKDGDLWIGTVGPGGKIVKMSPIGGTPGSSPINDPNKKITPVNTPFKLPNGQPVVVNAENPEMAGKMAKGLDAAAKMRRTIKRMIEIDAKNGGAWVGKDLALYKKLHAQAQVGFKGIEDLGALDVGVERMSEKVLPDVPTWGIGKNFDSDRAMLDDMVGDLDFIISNTIERYGNKEAPSKIPQPLQKKSFD